LRCLGDEITYFIRLLVTIWAEGHNSIDLIPDGSIATHRMNKWSGDPERHVLEEIVFWAALSLEKLARVAHLYSEVLERKLGAFPFVCDFAAGQYERAAI